MSDKLSIVQSDEHWELSISLSDNRQIVLGFFEDTTDESNNISVEYAMRDVDTSEMVGGEIDINLKNSFPTDLLAYIKQDAKG